METLISPSQKVCGKGEYCSLEPTSLSLLGIKPPSFNGASELGLYDVTSAVFTMLFMAAILAATYRFVVASLYMLEASEQGQSKAKAIFKQTILGLLGIFLLFPLLLLLNRQILVGDVGGGLRGGGGAHSQSTSKVIPTTASSATGSSGKSSVCDTKEIVISKLNSSSGICGGTSCTILTGCLYKEYLPIIERESSLLGVDPDMVVVTMCKESGGKKIAKNKNENGTFDCGLMQINQKEDCGEAILNPEENIKQGVTLLKKKMSAVSLVYPKIPAETGVFASYNCCANRTIPNDISSDCTIEAGFPYAIPKWACPINPGEGSYNMCSVKKYVCELSACLKQLQ